jgi:LPXTG-motif cell wall-anchored protein
VLTGSFTVPQKVPETGNTTTLIGMGIIGTGLLLRQRRKTSSRNLIKANL